MNTIIPATPYRCDVLVVIAESDKQFKKAITLSIKDGGKLYGDMNGTTDMPENTARFWGLPKGDCIIRMHDLRTVHDQGRLLHEVMHAVNHILDNKGVTFSESSEEAYTYLAQYIYEEASLAWAVHNKMR